MGALVVNPDKAPVPTQQIVQDLKEIIPTVCAVHGSQVSREQSHEGNLGQGVGISIGGVGSHGGLAQSMARLGDTLQLLGATDQRHPTSQGFTTPLTSGGTRAEIDQQLMRLRLLNSSNTCYMSATIIAWLHAVNRLSCNDRQAYGSRMQAWRDVAQSLRPIHVHAPASWRSILAGWRDLHRQQDASELGSRRSAPGGGWNVGGRDREPAPN